MTPTSPVLIVTYADDIWHGDWSDGYTVLQRAVDATRTGVYRAHLEVQYQGVYLDTATIDLLSLRAREDFAIALGSKNGVPPVVWDTRLGEFYRQVQDAQAAAAACSNARHIPHAVVVTLSNVEAEATQWLWWPYIALGTVCILDGDPGVGKTLLMTQLAANLSMGHPFPDQQGKPTLPTGAPAHTLLLSVEDSLTRTLKPRLVAAGAECTKIHALTSWLDAEGHEQAFTFEHLEYLEEALQTYQPRLVVIDPVTSYMGKTDIHRANEVQVLMAKLNRLAERADCAMVCIRHPAKPGQHIGKAIHRGLGSVGFMGTARTALFAEEHPTDKAKVLLGQSKSNMERLGRTQLYTKEDGHFQWCGVSRISAEMMAGSGRGPDTSAFLEALFWLEDYLKGEIPLPGETIRTDAEEEGIAFRTLQRAKKALQVRSIKRSGEKDQWDWQLPSIPLISSPPLYGSLDSLDSLGIHGVLGSLPQKQPLREESRVNQVDQVSQERQVSHTVSPGGASAPPVPPMTTVTRRCPTCKMDVPCRRVVLPDGTVSISCTCCYRTVQDPPAPSPAPPGGPPSGNSTWDEGVIV